MDPGLIAGARAIPGAFGFLRGRRGLWPFCVVPLLLNLCVFGLATPEAWYEWLWVGPLRLLAWALRWVLVAFFALAVYFLFAVIGTVIASPFLDVLSARVERAVTGGAVAPGGGVLRALGAEARRVLFFLGVQLGWIALALVPGMQPFSVLGLFVSSALFLPLEYTSYLLDRRSIRFAERRAWLWSHRRAMFGFGATAFVSFLVPGLNFVCLPLLVTAGTRLALEIGPPTASLPAAG